MHNGIRIIAATLAAGAAVALTGCASIGASGTAAQSSRPSATSTPPAPAAASTMAAVKHTGPVVVITTHTICSAAFLTHPQMHRLAGSNYVAPAAGVNPDGLVSCAFGATVGALTIYSNSQQAMADYNAAWVAKGSSEPIAPIDGQPAYAKNSTGPEVAVFYRHQLMVLQGTSLSTVEVVMGQLLRHLDHEQLR